MLVKSLSCDLTENSFWNSVHILISKPHVVNKRQWGNKILLKINGTFLKPDWYPLALCEKVTYNEFENNISYLLEKLQIQENIDNELANENAVELILMEHFPKNYCDLHAFQVILVLRSKAQVVFVDVSPDDKQKLCPDFSYTLELQDNGVVLKAYTDCTSRSYVWLVDTMLPQFVKWATENPEKQDIGKESLALVANEEYYMLYNDLKLKHGKEIVKIWPECTDPSKFVYEDIAIATYLLLIWRDERERINSKKLQTFVDLGCGNGLLVYILTMEGHSGLGIDVRKRQIWDMYPEAVKLQERTIVPSDTHLFPEVDYIIGNHSDELTPWIPVVAARSSHKCNFFILPCCAYNFDGSKYQRKNSSKSQYTEYLEYIQQLCQSCGFTVERDRLKIPSTKRICFVSRERNYPKSEYTQKCQEIQEIITKGEVQINKKMWVNNFKPREANEKVRNCTQIDRNVIDALVHMITKYLLIEVHAQQNWSSGKVVDINEVVQLIPEDMLKKLKSECGGLQTLLRNHHQIFQVQGGKVQLRHPKTVKEVFKDVEKHKNKSNNLRIKQKLCWFYVNHPQGCPLDEENCSYIHVKS